MAIQRAPPLGQGPGPSQTPGLATGSILASAILWGHTQSQDTGRALIPNRGTWYVWVPEQQPEQQPGRGPIQAGGPRATSGALSSEEQALRLAVPWEPLHFSSGRGGHNPQERAPGPLLPASHMTHVLKGQVGTDWPGSLGKGKGLLEGLNGPWGHSCIPVSIRGKVRGTSRDQSTGWEKSPRLGG